VADEIPNPYRKTVISVSDEDEMQVWDYLNHPAFLTKDQGRIVPKRHAERLRFAHLDLATSGTAGIAICHLVATQLVAGCVQDGKVFDAYHPLVEFDFILTVVAGRTRPIYFKKIIDFFIWLRGSCGFRFGMITADSFQSAFLLQTLHAAGFALLGMNLLRKRALRSHVSNPTRHSDETNPIVSPLCRHFLSLAVGCHSLR